MQFLKTTVIGGVVFLVPVVVLLLVLNEAVALMLLIAEPLADVVPMDSIAGVATANVIAVFAILLACFVAGLIARTRSVTRLAEKLERAILSKLPGYAMIKSIATTLDPSQQAELQPVLVNFDVRSRLGLEVEQVGEDRRVVYFPGAPNAWAGIVEIVPAERVEKLDAATTDVLAHCELIGKHTADLLARR